MFQSFETTSRPERSAERLTALRGLFDELGIDAMLVPRTDEHQNEYPAPHSERLAWLSGFTGSAGFAVVAREAAYLFSDGRYTLQMREQTDGNAWYTRTLPEETLGALLRKLDGATLGIDPWLHTIAEIRKLERQLDNAGGELVRLTSNPIDSIWTDRPAPPRRAVTVHPKEYAGRLAKDKLADAVEALSKANATSHVVTDPLSLCWLFNLRGSDAAHNPAAHGWAVLHATRHPIVFLDEKRMALSTKSYLTQLADIAPEGEFVGTLRDIASEGPVLLDPDRAAEALRLVVEKAGGTAVEGTDPALLPRAVKNDVEIEGARTAHRRDGAAMATFLAWLDSETPGTVSEIAAA